MTVGGWQWERDQASELMRAALESGDFDALMLAWSRLGDALVNQLISLGDRDTDRKMTPLRNEMVDVHAELTDVHNERKEDAAQFEHRLGMLIILAKKAQAEQRQMMAQIGLMRSELKEHIEQDKTE